MSESSEQSILTGEVVFIILAVLFASSVFLHLYNSSNDSSVWEDFYSKQISTFVNSGVDGQEISINVQKGVSIANRNDIDTSIIQSLFRFDSLTKEVCVQLDKVGPTCYPYFNEVVISHVDSKVIDEGMILTFRINKLNNGGDNE